MAKIEDLSVVVNVEGVFQKELMKVVERLYNEHGVKIEEVSFGWLSTSFSENEVISCRTTSSYSKYD